MRGFGAPGDGLIGRYAAALGIGLIVLGLLGFVDDPLVGDAADRPLIVTDATLDLIHLVTGVLALFVAYGLDAEARANGLVALGAAYGVLVVLLLLSPDLGGNLARPANAGLQVLHLAIAVASVAIGQQGRMESATGR